MKITFIRFLGMVVGVCLVSSAHSFAYCEPPLTPGKYAVCTGPVVEGSQDWIQFKAREMKDAQGFTCRGEVVIAEGKKGTAPETWKQSAYETGVRFLGSRRGQVTARMFIFAEIEQGPYSFLTLTQDWDGKNSAEFESSAGRKVALSGKSCKF